MRFTIVAACLLALVTPLYAQTPPGPLPAGQGRDIVAVACTQCHSVATFMNLREGPIAWRAQVYDMILRGAQVRLEEIDAVVAYLTVHFGPGVDLPTPPAAILLPEGRGRDLVQRRCSLCHGLDRITAARRSAAEWQSVVSRMAFLGASVSADEGKQITGYLSGTFGP